MNKFMLSPVEFSAGDIYFNETLIHSGRKTLAEEKEYLYNRRQCNVYEKSAVYR